MSMTGVALIKELRDIADKLQVVKRDVGTNNGKIIDRSLKEIYVVIDNIKDGSREW